MLVFTFVVKLLNKLHTILRIIVVFHWIYKPFIFKIFFSNFQIICSRRKIIYSPYLFGGKIERNEVSKRKLWKFNIAIKGVYFFFCIYDNRPCHFFCCRFFDLFGWTFACHFMGRVHRIFSLSRFRERKRFFMPLQEFVVHFKTGTNLWLTLKNAFVCFQLFKRWWWFWKHFWMTL